MARKSFLSVIKLDARPDRLDLRDLIYRPPVASLPPQWPLDRDVQEMLPRYVADGLILNQGSEGACTGFGLACVVNYLLWSKQLAEGGATRFQSVSPRMLYHLARFYDEWPGEDYHGSSCRGAMKAWHKHGVCGEAHWSYRDSRQRVRYITPAQGWEHDAATRLLGVYYRIDKRSVVDMQAAIRQVGAIYCSANVHDGWSVAQPRLRELTHATLPAIVPPPDGERGGHAFALVGFNPRGFIVQNSWGEGWGGRGFAILPYADWVENGTDAWVCALGVPVNGAMAPTHYVDNNIAQATQGLAGLAGATLIGIKDELRVDHIYSDPAVKPWSAEQAYNHSVVMGNNGRVISRLVTAADAADSVRKIACEAPAQWFVQSSGKPRLMVYAHGGLNAEADSINRVRILAPYFEANGIYPVFITWKTGPLETLSNMIEDTVRDLPTPPGADWMKTLKHAAAEALDRTIEVVCEAASVKSVWSQMKQNAREASAADGGMTLLVKNLAALAKQVPDLELHFVGHSAGSIILGHALGAMRGTLGLASCTLYAPACRIDFANEHYAAAQLKGVLAPGQLHIHLLSDEREQDDKVGPYNKSLLYLVSRALEDTHKTPLLGLARAFDARRNHTERGGWAETAMQSLEKWQQFWKDSGNKLHPLSASSVSDGAKMIPAAHGSFDNDVDVVTATIRRIRGAALKSKVENLSC